MVKEKIEILQGQLIDTKSIDTTTEMGLEDYLLSTIRNQAIQNKIDILTPLIKEEEATK